MEPSALVRKLINPNIIYFYMVSRAFFLVELYGFHFFLLRLPPVNEKLTRTNHLVWKAQVLSALKGAQFAESRLLRRSSSPRRQPTTRSLRCPILTMPSGWLEIRWYLVTFYPILVVKSLHRSPLKSWRPGHGRPLRVCSPPSPVLASIAL